MASAITSTPAETPSPTFLSQEKTVFLQKVHLFSAQVFMTLQENYRDPQGLNKIKEFVAQEFATKEQLKTEFTPWFEDLEVKEAIGALFRNFGTLRARAEITFKDSPEPS